MKEVIINKIKASAIHLFFSIIVALLSSFLILNLWFPGQYRAMAGGSHLLMLIISVDVVLGPLLTAIVFDRRKPRSELVRDLGVILVLQTAGLFYGIHTVYLARPVALVFEQTRFRIVSFVQIDSSEMSKEESGVSQLSLAGPVLLSVRDFKDDREKSDAAEKGLAGMDVGMRQKFWQPYLAGEKQIRRAARPYTDLLKKYPADSVVNATPGKIGFQVEKLVFIPVVTRNGDWVVILSSDTLQPLDFISKDGFF